MTITITDYSAKRMNGRGITRTMIDAALCFGEKVYARDSLYLFLGKRAVKRLMKVFVIDNPEKWEGVTLVLDPKTHDLITTYKNKNWLKKIRHKH